MKNYFFSLLASMFFLLFNFACSTDDPVITPEKIVPTLSLSSNEIICSQNETKKEVDIETNIDLTLISISAGDNWATCVLNKKTKKIQVVIQENTARKARKTAFVVKGGGLSDSIKIEQMGLEPDIIFTKTEYVFDSNEQILTVVLESNIDNILVTPSHDWIVKMETKSFNKYTYTFQITENTESDTRLATISFANEDKSVSKSVQIKQAAVLPLIDLTMAYNLNVIYFIPNDITAPAEYERRLSELILWMRDFYAKNMERNGYGYRAFGLRQKSANRINLITINGKLGHQSYGYDGGNGAVSSEVNQYFAANPTASEGNHSLIIIPSYTGNPMSPGGPPFYGTGRSCYALDYEGMDIKYLGESSEKGRLLTKWFGGMAHELGHGINLPHNSQLVGEKLGTTLMGAGNYTLGIEPTFLSKASCALLNNCQVFSPIKKEFYQPNSTLDIENFHIEHKATTINVSGEFKNPSKPINAINIYVDDYPYTGVNENYDAESWSISNLKDNKFSIAIPLNAIKKDNDSFRVRTWFLFDDGTYSEESHDFDRTALIDFHFVTEQDMAKDNWTIVASDSDGSSPAELMLDNMVDTYWHSQWQGEKPGHPHTITVTMPEAKKIKGLSFVQRQSLHGAVNEFEVEVSTDGISWEFQGNYNLAYAARKQFIYLPEAKTVKMFKIRTVSNHTSHDPLIAAIAEIGAFE